MKKVIISNSSSSSLKISGFSLVEAMIMLVVVSIIMAVLAPLMVNKAKANQGKAIYTSGGNVLTAQGSNQNLVIGQNGSTTEKLVVNGKAKVSSGLTVGESEITSESIRIGKSDSAALNVDKDGKTNIEISVPDYGKKTTISTSCVAPSNGFFYISDSLKSYTITPNSSDTPCSVPTDDTNELNLTVTTAGGSSSFPMLVPVQKGDKMECGASATCYFMPLANANTNKNT